MTDKPDFDLNKFTRKYTVQQDISGLPEALQTHTHNFLGLLERGENLPALAKATEQTVAQLEKLPFLALPLLIAGTHLAKDPEYMPVAIDAAIKAHTALPDPRLKLVAATLLLDIAQSPDYPQDRRASLALSAGHLVPSDEGITKLLLAQVPANDTVLRSQIKLGFDEESAIFKTYARQLTALAHTIAHRPLLQDKTTPPNQPGASPTP